MSALSSLTSTAASVIQTQTSASQISISLGSSSASSILSRSPSAITTSLEPVAPFPKGSRDVSLHTLSYLEYSELRRFSTASKGTQDLMDSKNFQVERAIFSTIKIFDRTHWKEYWNSEVTKEYDASEIDPKVLRAFLTAYYGKNPIGPGRVCDNCLIPTVVPKGIWFKIQSGYFYENHSLSLLEKIAEHPLKGHAAKYMNDQVPVFKQHGKTPARKPSRLVIQLKNVIGPDKPWSKESPNPDEQGQVQILSELFARTGWGCLPDALSQNTIVFAHHAITGERPLGDETGIEGRSTYGRTVELVRHGQEAYYIISGGFTEVGPVEGFAPAELGVIFSVFDNEPFIGVSALREF